jgi:hypothetical protein
MKKIIYSIILLFVFAGKVQGQQGAGNITGTKWKLVYYTLPPFCPSPTSFSATPYGFTLLPLPLGTTNVTLQNFAPPTFSWKVQNAMNADVSFNTNQREFSKTNDSGVNLYFDNTTEKAKLTVTITGCGRDNADYKVYDVTETFELPIRSNRGETPKNLSINGSIAPTFNVQYNNTQEQFTLAVEPMKIPNSTTAYVDMYEYRIPNNWSLGTNASNVSFQGVQNGEKVVWVTQSPDGSAASTKLNIKFDDCGTGKIRVRSMIKPSCAPYADPNEPYAAYYSQYSSEIYINRTLIPSTTTVAGNFFIYDDAHPGSNLADCGKSGIATITVKTPLTNVSGNFKYQWEIVPVASSPTNWSFVAPNNNSYLLETPATLTASGLSASVNVQSVPDVPFQIRVRPVAISVAPLCLSGFNTFAGTNAIVDINRVAPILRVDMAVPKNVCSDMTDVVKIPVTIYANDGIRDGIMIPDAYTAVSSNPSLLIINHVETPHTNKFMAHIMPSAVGTVTVTFTGRNTCGITSSIEKTFSLVSGSPAGIGSLYTNPREPFCINRDKQFWIDPVPNTTYYIWRAITKDIILGYRDTEGSILSPTYGTKKFSITAFNGCDSVRKVFSVAIPLPTRGIILPCNVRVGTNGKEIGINDVNPYPNPAQDILNISLPTIFSEDLTLSLCNSFGQLKKAIKIDFEKVSDDNTLQLNIDDLPNGMYVLHVIDGNNIQQHQIMIAK